MSTAKSKAPMVLFSVKIVQIRLSSGSDLEVAIARPTGHIGWAFLVFRVASGSGYRMNISSPPHVPSSPRFRDMKFF